MPEIAVHRKMTQITHKKNFIKCKSQTILKLNNIKLISVMEKIANNGVIVLSS